MSKQSPCSGPILDANLAYSLPASAPMPICSTCMIAPPHLAPAPYFCNAAPPTYYYACALPNASTAYIIMWQSQVENEL